jgi:hypothetical protein
LTEALAKHRSEEAMPVEVIGFSAMEQRGDAQAIDPASK